MANTTQADRQPQATVTPCALLRRPSVERSTGMARTTIYRRIKQGVFPRPVDLGGGIVGWPASEIDAVNHARVAGKSDDEIKALVAQLHKARMVGGVQQ